MNKTDYIVKQTVARLFAFKQIVFSDQDLYLILTVMLFVD